MAHMNRIFQIESFGKLGEIAAEYLRKGSQVYVEGSIRYSIGRALGETMAVTMLIGNIPEISASIMRPGHSMAAVIANEFREADSAIYLSALVAVGLVLFVASLFINIGARLLLWRMRGASAKH